MRKTAGWTWQDFSVKGILVIVSVLCIMGFIGSSWIAVQLVLVGFHYKEKERWLGGGFVVGLVYGHEFAVIDRSGRLEDLSTRPGLG